MANSIPPQTQDQIVKFISSFALYGFPESHAASFALIAYASAFLKVRYLAAFTAALLNNWPMGFYHPATIVKDAQRHGLRVQAGRCDALRVELHDRSRRGESTLPPHRPALCARTAAGRSRISDAAASTRALRLGRRSGASRASTQPRQSGYAARLLARSTISLRRRTLHRRDALWQVEKAVRRTGPLLEGIVELDSASPLRRMNVEERLVADYHGTGLTTGHHPMAYRREILRARGVISAIELRNLPHGKEATTAGCVITRQRPGTAKGLIFMTLEDETGTSRVIISPGFLRPESNGGIERTFRAGLRSGTESGQHRASQSAPHPAAFNQRGDHAFARFSFENRLAASLQRCPDMKRLFSPDFQAPQFSSKCCGSSKSRKPRAFFILCERI